MNLKSAHLRSTLFFLLALLILSACSGNGGKSATETANEKTVITLSPDPDSPATQLDTALSSPGTSDRNSGEIAPLEVREPQPVTTTTGRLPGRSFDEERMSVLMDLIAHDLEAQKLAYISSLGQDCSGIYHKVKDQIQKKMSELGDPEKYVYPSFTVDRNSRQIADWYHRNGNLHIVQDGMADRNLIRPGSVMFYGRTEEKYNNLSIEILTNPGKFVHDGTNGKIMHVAVVTEVVKDEEGNVVNYTIMHGRNKKYPASRSAGNHEGPGYERVFKSFPFGNWNQQWVAIAQIETPKS